MSNNNIKPLEIIDENSIKELFYDVRGQKVMFDFDLARIYGYETRYFNRQVRNNIERFDEDFMFQITKDELAKILMCKNFTSSWGGTRKLPYVFTEQGIYMLMTVLKTELAISQSKQLIRCFKAMKDYIIESNVLLTNSGSFIESKFSSYDKRFEVIENKLSLVMDNFVDPAMYKHFLILNGEKIEADLAYQNIYKLANNSIIIIDDYIGVKTLDHLKICKENIKIIICSDNVARNNLPQSFIDDFIQQTSIKITIKKTNNVVHDRYIIIDYKTDNERIYLCGPSSKDAGNKIGTIIEIENKMQYYQVIDGLIKD